MAKFGVITVCKHDNSKMFFGQKSDQSTHAPNAPGVHSDELPSVVLQKPTQTVSEKVRVRLLGGGVERGFE